MWLKSAELRMQCLLMLRTILSKVWVMAQVITSSLVDKSRDSWSHL
jgi:hypothetical protein